MGDHGVTGAPRRNSAGLARDIDLLDALGADDPAGEGLGVLRLAELVGRDKAAVSRALATLAGAGLVVRDPETRAYRLGPRLYALSARTAESALASAARPVLRQVAARTRETAHLVVLHGASVLTVASQTSPREVATSAWDGRSSPSLRSSSGRVLLIDWSDEEVDTWLSELAAGGAGDPFGDVAAPPEGRFPVRPPGPSPAAVVHDAPSLHAELARIRHRGWAVSDQELESGVLAVSAPVRDATGAVVAALNLSAPALRLRPRVGELAPEVVRWADRISVCLGWHPHPRPPVAGSGS